MSWRSRCAQYGVTRNPRVPEGQIPEEETEPCINRARVREAVGDTGYRIQNRAAMVVGPRSVCRLGVLFRRARDGQDSPSKGNHGHSAPRQALGGRNADNRMQNTSTDEGAGLKPRRCLCPSITPSLTRPDRLALISRPKNMPATSSKGYRTLGDIPCPHPAATCILAAGCADSAWGNTA